MVRENRSPILNFLDKLNGNLNKLPKRVQKVMPQGMLNNLKGLLANFKKFFNKLATTSADEVAAETTKALAVSQGSEKIDKA